MNKIIAIIFLNFSIFGASLEVGDNAPDFSLMNQDGLLRQLDDFKGQKLVIYFFPKAKTPGWIKQACGFRDEFESFEKYNISILGVSYDSKNSLKSFRKKYNLKFDLLSDSNRVMGNAYGVNKFYFFPSRKTFLIDEKGKLIHIFNEVNLRTHPLDILESFNQQQQ